MKLPLLKVIVHTPRRFLWKHCSVFILMCLALGCGDNAPTGDVCGTITFKGDPVIHGDVVFFQPGTGRVTQGSLDSEGAYKLVQPPEGLPAGEYKITVSPLRSYVKFDGPNGKEDKLVLQGEKSIPKKYRERDTTPLSASVTGGSDTFDFELE